MYCRGVAGSIGKRVLQLDQSNEYGGRWSSLTLDQMLTLEDACRDRVNKYDETFRPKVEIFKSSWRKTDADGTVDYAWRRRLPRRFAVDLTPRMVYSKSLFIDVAIKCGIVRYLEFQGLKAKVSLIEDKQDEGGDGGLEAHTSVTEDGVNDSLFTIPMSKSGIFL